MQAERVCLSLTSSYAAHWGAWEGLRELVQNWHDGALAAAGERDEVRFTKLGEYTYEARGSGGAALGSARYDGATQTLALTNVGAVDRTAHAGPNSPSDNHAHTAQPSSVAAASPPRCVGRVLCCLVDT